MLVQPFVTPWSRWWWLPTNEAYLNGAEINAEVVSADENGLILRRNGDRPISVILPPVRWSSDSPPVLRVRCCAEELSREEQPPLDSSQRSLHAPDPAVPIFVRLLWQESPGKAYRYVEQQVYISGIVMSIDLPMPVLPDRVYRAGVQFVELDEPLRSVRLVELVLPDLSVTRRVALAWRSFSEPEPIANHSVNFLRGPTILGRSLNGMLLLLTLTGIGAAGALAAARRRPLTRRAIIAPLLIAWFVVDGWATWNLARQGRTERETFAVLTPKQQLARTWGEDVAWAAEALRRHAPPGATFAVVSDDPFYPAHRLDYLLVPVYRRVEEPAQADYVAVIRASDERLSAVQNPTLHLHRVASKESNVVLLERRVAR